MLTRARRHLLGAIALVLGGWLTGAVSVAAPTFAAGPGCETTDVNGECVVQVGGPAAPPPAGGGAGGTTPTGSGDQGRACISDGTGWDKGPVPCTIPKPGGGTAWWSNTYQCYAFNLEKQPPAGDPYWQGHEPGDGAVYGCIAKAGGTGYLVVGAFWAPNPPDGMGGGGPTPYQVAQMALAKMNFKAGDIGIVPEPGPNKLGIVGMPTWMWVKNPGPNTTGPITTSASAGGITVTATAELDRIEWDMGDGTTVTCAGSRAKGTPYSDGYGRQDSPTCGHRYERTSGDQPNNAYTVTAQSFWVVNWSGAGQSGTITLDPLTRSVQIRVGELQVLQQR